MRTFGCVCAAMTIAASTAAQEAGDAARARRITPAVRVFNQTKDAVVNISTTQIVQVQDSFDDLDWMFRRGLFDLPLRTQPRTFKAQSVGSGSVVHRSGYLVTNAHVVAQTKDCKVIFADKTELDAEIVGTDSDNDLAILKVKTAKPLPEIKIGRSDDLMVGEAVVAIGNPLGLQHTCTVGVVSALDRKLEVNERQSFEGLIQTDASINPGNSGGPLLNVDGELIGINFAIRGDGQNIGFAIPVEKLLRNLPNLLDVERRYRILTGVEITPEGDAVVMRVTPKLPAAEAGLQVGDRIVAMNGEPVRRSPDFHFGLLGKRPGEQAPLEFERAGRRYKTALLLAEKPKPDGARLAQEKLGLTLEELEPAVARRLGLKPKTGLFAARVEPQGPAEAAQLRESDLLMQIEGSQVGALDDLGALLERFAAGKSIRVVALRFSNQTVYRVATRLAVR
jgi:serine protease Do